MTAPTPPPRPGGVATDADTGNFRSDDADDDAASALSVAGPDSDPDAAWTVVPTGARRLAVLLVDSSPEEAGMLTGALTDAGFELHFRCVGSPGDLRQALASERWDVVLADPVVPGLGPAEVLAVLRESERDLPFLVVSRTAGEEGAVAALKAGAHDFINKQKLGRLVPAIERELREALMREEQRRLREQLMVAERMATVGTLAASVAHEINNPLSAVVANLELALRRLEGVSDRPELEELRAELRDAHEAAHLVRQIVRDVKVFSRGGDERPGPVDVRQVLDSTARMAWSEIRHRARLQKQYDEVPPVWATDARLGQVFLNLIINAAQAIDVGRAESNRIRLHTRTDSRGRALVEIADTGAGIPAEQLPRVFAPFFSTKPAGMGTGLGLSISSRIVKELGGEIRVESRVGRGTTVSVALPPAIAGPASRTA
jgi:signal transduction histidine kinase